ncbi:MAG TPA: hypothetical protein VEW08_14900 [Steroidobacteraceae bacterium]|nr:hypothetical protein [Steroidobacteraceae bacterium]
MKIRSPAAVFSLIALVATPFAAHANGSTRATDACIRAFVDSYLLKDRPMQVQKLSSVQGAQSFYGKRYTIALNARLASNGTELVTAQCVASTNGEVISLDLAPATTGPTASAN